MSDPTAAIATIVVLGVAAQWVAAQLRIPSILLLLAAGLLAGPVTGLVEPDELLGDLLFPVVSLGVGLLLFEGGLGLHRSEIGSWRGALLRLLTVGVVITGVIATVAAATVGGLPTRTAVLFGSIMTVTGPTVIIPLLRQARLRPRVGRVLRWEGICIDAVGATLAIVALEVIVLEGEGLRASIEAVALTAGTGVVIGLVVAAALALVLGRRLVPDHLEIAVITMAVLVAFAGSNHLREEAGLFAVTALGIGLANQRRAPVRHVVAFQESLGVLVIGGIFVLLAAQVEAQALQDNLVPGIAVLVVLVVVARPLAVLASTVGSSLTRNERLYLAGLAPRGIVAASVSALFALKLDEAGIAGGEDLAALTFVVVAGTVVVYGLAARPLSTRLRVSVPEPHGVAIIGAPPWAVELGAKLAAAEVAVLVVATDEDEVRMARHADLLVYNGRLVHRDLDEAVEAMGVRIALALSGREELNAFAAERFVEILGRANVYELPRTAEEGAEHHGGIGGEPLLTFGGGLDAEEIRRAIGEGGAVVSLSAEEAASCGDTFAPLLAVTGGSPSATTGQVPPDADVLLGILRPVGDPPAPDAAVSIAAADPTRTGAGAVPLLGPDPT